MTTRSKIILPVASVIVISFSFAALALTSCANSELFPGTVSVNSDGILVTIDPRLEFMSGILSQFQWQREPSHGPGADGYPYAQELSAFMTPHRDSMAVQMAAKLYDYGFSYDAPPTFALNLEGTALSDPVAGYSDNLLARKFLVPELSSFREAFAQLYVNSSFKSFLASNRKRYMAWVNKAASGLNAGKLISWMEDFYGSERQAEFRVVLAPALFPSGGYGPTIKRLGKKDLFVAVIRAAGHGQTDPAFPEGSALALLLLHEFGHSFVNPSVLLPDSSMLVANLAKLFEPVFPQMADLAYGDLQTMVDELVLRAAVLVAASDLGILDEAKTEQAIRNEELSGFYLIRNVISILRDYSENRLTWPNFSSYAQQLLTAISADPDSTIAQARLNVLLPADAVTGFTENFEGQLTPSALPPGFSVIRGSVIPQAVVRYSSIGVQQGEACTGGKALVLSADADTSHYLYMSKPLQVLDGEVTASFYVSHSDIYPEGQQYSGSYVGFIATDRQGTRRFAVRQYRGSSDWKKDEIRMAVDQKTVTLEFAVFLNESGTLRVDDVSVAYR